MAGSLAGEGKRKGGREKQKKNLGIISRPEMRTGLPRDILELYKVNTV